MEKRARLAQFRNARGFIPHCKKQSMNLLVDDDVDIRRHVPNHGDTARFLHLSFSPVVLPLPSCLGLAQKRKTQNESKMPSLFLL
jgi:hypothetical protein